MNAESVFGSGRRGEDDEPRDELAEGLSVVVPAYNEAGTIASVVAELLEVLPRVTPACEVIVVDDGSRDATSVLADRLAAADARVRVCHHPVNHGYGAAQRTGLAAAQFAWVVVLPADGQFDPSELISLWEARVRADLVSSRRRVRYDGWLRAAISRLYNGYLRMRYHSLLRDTNWVKLWRRSTLAAIDSCCLGFAVDGELVVKAQRLGLRVCEVPVGHRRRTAGDSTAFRLSAFWQTARELLALSAALKHFCHRLAPLDFEALPPWGGEEGAAARESLPSRTDVPPQPSGPPPTRTDPTRTSDPHGWRIPVPLEGRGGSQISASVPAARVDLDYVMAEQWRTVAPPLSARLPFHYHRVPVSARLQVARVVVASRGTGCFPHAPAEPAVDAARWVQGTLPHWPEGRRYAVILTHDVDTPAGWARIPAIAELERSLGFRSAFFVCSHRYRIDMDLLERLEADGFEVASHGYNHDTRTAFLPPSARRRRLDAVLTRLRPQVPLLGYRSEALTRTPALMADLGGRFSYDSSVPDVGWDDGGGCATVFPYRLGGLIELPVTLPMDASLLFRGITGRDIFTHWREKLAWIRRVGGLATVVLHADPHLGGSAECLRHYAAWLSELGSDAWVALPREVARQADATLPPFL